MNTTTQATKTINSGNINSVAMRTIEAWQNHPAACGYAANQFWTFTGGDAIIVITGQHPYVVTLVFIRVGNQVHTLEASGLRQAMGWIGLHESDYQIAS